MVVEAATKVKSGISTKTNSKTWTTSYIQSVMCVYYTRMCLTNKCRKNEKSTIEQLRTVLYLPYTYSTVNCYYHTTKEKGKK